MSNPSEWLTILAVCTLIGGASGAAYFWDRLVAWMERRRRTSLHVKKLDDLSLGLTFTNKHAPEPQRETPLGAGEVWGATISGRTPFFINTPFTDLALARQESKRSGKPLFIVIYDAEHSRQSQIRYTLGCALDEYPLKQKVDLKFVVCFTHRKAPGVAELIPHGAWLEAPLLLVFRTDGTLQWMNELRANSTNTRQDIESILKGGTSYGDIAGAAKIKPQDYKLP